MFRELTRKNKQLSNDDCINILINEKRGVLSVNGDGEYPYGIPMNHFYNITDGCIYFHSGKGGHKLDSLKVSNKVSYCVYNQGYQNSGEWALNIKSVIVFGTAEIIDDTALITDICEKLSRKFTDDTEYIETEIRNYAKNTLLIRLNPEHICGKAIKES